MENYEKLSKRIEDTFTKLEETISNINILTNHINDINTSTEKLVQAIKELSENENTKKLIQDHRNISKAIRRDISTIQSNLVETEGYRTFFQDEISKYNVRTERFSETFDKKAEIANSANKDLAKMIANLIKQQNDINSSRNRINKIAEEIDLFNHYEEVKKEQKEQRELLEKIFNSIK